MKRIWRLLFSLAAAAAIVIAADTANSLFEKALVKERADADLRGAIKLYEQIVHDYSRDRKLAAQALVRMGQCYEKLGNADARKAYEQVLSKFGEQTAAVAEARERLAKLGGGGQTEQLTTKLVWGSPRSWGHSISPDGRYLSYTDWNTGNLIVRDLVTGADRALTTGVSMKAGEEIFATGGKISRDGKQIAYEWWNEKLDRGELRVTSLNGDPTPRRMFEAWIVIPSDWSPDGKWIAANWVQKRDNAKPDWNQDMSTGLIDARDGALRVLKSGTGDYTAYGFSPDGNNILYGRHGQGSDTRVYILSLDGKSDVALLSEPFPIPGRFPVQSPIWTPDGTRIVFGSSRAYASSGLWFVRVVAGKPAGRPEQIKGEFGSAYPIGFTRDGSLFYRADSPRTDIYVADLDPVSGKLASEPKRVNERAPGKSWGRLAWLPDGKSLSFWNRRDGRDALIVHTLATGEERELWTADGSGGNPGYAGWFPDGSLMSMEKSGRNRILHRVDGLTLETRATWTIPDWDSPPAFSRDLMTAYFVRKDAAVPCNGAACLYVMVARDIETGRDKELFRLEAVDLGGQSVSPDGRDLAFVAMPRNERGTSGRALMIAPIDGGMPRELWRGPGSLTFTTWTQDGTHVLASSARSGEEGVWSFPVKGGPPEKSRVHMHVNGVVSPDGKRIALAGTELTSGIWVVTGIFSNAKPAAAR